jgi:hypothetical protein
MMRAAMSSTRAAATLPFATAARSAPPKYDVPEPNETSPGIVMSSPFAAESVDIVALQSDCTSAASSAPASTQPHIQVHAQPRKPISCLSSAPSVPSFSHAYEPLMRLYEHITLAAPAIAMRRNGCAYSSRSVRASTAELLHVRACSCSLLMKLRAP